MRSVLIAIAMLLVGTADAQHNHGAGHGEYHDWRSRKAPHSCCNEQDCGAMTDAEVRETETGTQVLVSGEWCPILPEHKLTRGRSPDWSVNHACIRPHGHGCDRVLCFIPRGGF
jgi:hypothetical protein